MKYYLFLLPIFMGCQGGEGIETIDFSNLDGGSDSSDTDSADSSDDSDTFDAGSDLDTDTDMDSDTDADSDVDTDTDSDADSDADTDSDGDGDSDSIFDGLCDFITCPEFPLFGGQVKYRSKCVRSEFPGVVPDTIIHFSAWSGECFEISGGYECRYKELEVECELDQKCGQRQTTAEPDYSFGVCLDLDTDSE